MAALWSGQNPADMSGSTTFPSTREKATRCSQWPCPSGDSYKWLLLSLPTFSVQLSIQCFSVILGSQQMLGTGWGHMMVQLKVKVISTVCAHPFVSYMHVWQRHVLDTVLRHCPCWEGNKGYSHPRSKAKTQIHEKLKCKLRCSLFSRTGASVTH